MSGPAKLDFAAQWGRLNETLVGLLDYIPEDKLDWSPRDDMWGFRTILSHVSSTRGNWLMPDGVDREEVLATVEGKDDLRRLLRESWSKVERYLSEQRYVDRVYEGEREGEETQKQDGVTGRKYGTLAEATEAAVAAQEELVAFVNGLSEASNRDETFDHFLFGPLNCREWAVFQRVHDGDHGGQIEKIKASDGFPSA